MQLRFKMINRDDYGIAALATVYGWAVSYMAAIWLALPLWAQSALQMVLTLALGLGALTAQHFLRRYLRHRWPDRKPREQQTNEEL